MLVSFLDRSLMSLLKGLMWCLGSLKERIYVQTHDGKHSCCLSCFQVCFAMGTYFFAANYHSNFLTSIWLIAASHAA